jgi:hypothetical protein
MRTDAVKVVCKEVIDNGCSNFNGAVVVISSVTERPGASLFVQASGFGLVGARGAGP